MTHLIIHPDILVRNAYLLEFLNQNLNKNFTEIIQLHNIADIHIIENLPSESIGIEEVKKFQKEMIYHPLELAYQAGIIFHAQTLTTEAQNALLKTLEEQPDTTLYILLVDNEKNLLETIVSRCTKHYVKTSTKSQVLSTNEEKTEKANKPEILALDLVEQFEKIVTILEDEDNGLGKLFDELQKYFKTELELGITEKEEDRIQRAIQALNKIQTTQMRTKANANKKISLENMMLQINKL